MNRFLISTVLSMAGSNGIIISLFSEERVDESQMLAQMKSPNERMPEFKYHSLAVPSISRNKAARNGRIYPETTQCSDTA